MLLKQRISIEFADDEATEFLNIFRKCKDLLIDTNKSVNLPYPVKEFYTEPEAREFLGGISRSLFYKLKNQDKFASYYCGEGRCLYSREELIAYIKNNKPSSK